jgi:branched-chain amino acid transport system permease protein|uniref:Branched-chain amino acid ABC transporter permease n=1 Tax=candidate division WOR-3 bacterium TaxID=2052148 RepID=A0A7C3YTT6_UNCW3
MKSFRIWYSFLFLYLALRTLFSLGIVNPYLQQIIIYIGIIIIWALGLNLIYGFSGQFSLGQAAFYGIGAYSGAILTKLFPQSIAIICLSLITSILLTGAIAFLIGIPVLRLRSDYLAIATLGFSIIAKVFFDNADSILPEFGGSRGMIGIPRYTTLEVAYLFVVLVIFLTRNLVNSKYGRALLALKDDEIVADVMGIDTARYKTFAFSLGSAFAGLAGWLYAHLYTFLHPSNFEFLKSIDCLLIVILGGMGSISGTIVASIAFVFLIEGLRIFLPSHLVEWRFVIYPLILIVMMIKRPQGLLGKRW